MEKYTVVLFWEFALHEINEKTFDQQTRIVVQFPIGLTKVNSSLLVQNIGELGEKSTSCAKCVLSAGK